MTLQGLQKLLASLRGEPAMEVTIVVDGEGFDIETATIVNGRIVIEVEENGEDFL